MGQPRFLIVSRPQLPDPARGGTVWRLLGANNRHLGQSEETFLDVAGCLAAIGRLQRGLDRSRSVIAGEEHGQLWRWRLELDGAPVASSTRAYRRQRECQYSLGLFLAGARSAEPGPRPLALPRQHAPAVPQLRPEGRAAQLRRSGV
ncbi:hypothetical protein ACGFX4_17565 [Kitasatospora sp. NPDC048365]|uniref:hypothetical protein n=1 Tax=Kitasatospora sp. NPDC048365 TaxID=3364050 RepID=UPI0037167BCC